ncbi:hypothetical protein TBS_19700 [Thermobispora bispora]
MRVVTFTYRATGQATRPTSGRSGAGMASAAAWATRIGSDLTLLTKIRETTTGFFTKPRRNLPRSARAFLASIFDVDVLREPVGMGSPEDVDTAGAGLLASDSTA